MPDAPDVPPCSPAGGLILPFRGEKPELGPGVFLASTAAVIGSVRLGRFASVWFGTVLRGDIAPIEVGEETNIQDNSVLHVGDEFPCLVGARCVVGHRAILHGCRVGDETLIGMGATLLNGVVVGPRSVIAAGSLLTEGTMIPEGSLVMGMPAKVVRPATEAMIKTTLHLAAKYVKVAQEYLTGPGR